MDPNTLSVIQGAAGAAGGDPVYVEEVFSTYLYDGTGSNDMPINNGIDLEGEGGMVWIKNRGIAWDHWIMDTERGVNLNLYANNDYPEPASYANTGINSFDDDGFTLGNASSGVNSANPGYCSWTFRKAPGFFDVVTYEGDGVAGKTISHNLGSAPGMILVKDLDAANWWICYHRSMGNTKGVYFNDTGAETDNTFWNDTDPTSTEFTVGAIANNNADGHDYVAYLFADGDDAAAQIFGDAGNESIIKCGTYTGNNSADGPEINLGWEPQWVMVRRRTGTPGLWMMADNMRGITTGGDDPYLQANDYAAEVDWAWIDLTSTGFKLTDANAVINANEDYVYMAIRRGPMKTPEDATDVFAIDYGNGSTTIPTWDSGFPVDMAIKRAYGSTDSAGWSARLLGSTYLTSDSASTNSSDGSLTWDSNKGWGKDYTSQRVSWMFKRAPGFFDVVAYEGTGSAYSVPHNLGKKPEMMIVKNTEVGYSWHVYHKDLTSASYNLELENDVDEDDNYGASWNNTEPDEDIFKVGTSYSTNESGKQMIAYLFASLDGVSSVGKYIGNGGTAPIDVHCDGFTNGARFVMIKRRDGAGNWYVFDTLRGINNNGGDPYLFMDTTGQQQGTISDSWANLIEPLSTGFTVDTATTALNTLNETFIYLAIA